jgi:hypothetical protein
VNFAFLLNATQLTANCKGMRQQYTLDDIKKKHLVCSISIMAARSYSNTSFGNCTGNAGYCNWLFHLTLQDMPKNETT